MTESRSDAYYERPLRRLPHTRAQRPLARARDGLHCERGAMEPTYNQVIPPPPRLSTRRNTIGAALGTQPTANSIMECCGPRRASMAVAPPQLDEMQNVLGPVARIADGMLSSITKSLTDGLGVTDEWANQWTLRRRASMDVPELVGLHDVSWGDDIALTLELADLESRYRGKSEEMLRAKLAKAHEDAARAEKGLAGATLTVDANKYSIRLARIRRKAAFLEQKIVKAIGVAPEAPLASGASLGASKRETSCAPSGSPLARPPPDSADAPNGRARAPRAATAVDYGDVRYHATPTAPVPRLQPPPAAPAEPFRVTCPAHAAQIHAARAAHKAASRDLIRVVVADRSCGSDLIDVNDE